MRIGYACLTIGVPQTQQKSCIQKNATEAHLNALIAWNLSALEHIIEYNIQNQIKLFRISSDLIPFGSSPVNQVLWWDAFAEDFARIGKKIRDADMRVSMHPGQYTVLNSPQEAVVSRAKEDLRYHATVLDCLGVDASHKIVLHIGGVYGDKALAIKRFEEQYLALPTQIQRRLVIENDDKSYGIAEVLGIGKRLGIPVVFDNLHHAIHTSASDRSEAEWIQECRETWGAADGAQKIHYAQQDPMKHPGAHAKTIRVQEFIDFCARIARKDLDIMLEVKDKNLSAMKCILSSTGPQNITRLETEWAKYKYLVLERAHAVYVKIRKLLKNKQEYPVISFYHMVELALENEINLGGAINAAQHVWGYFSAFATEKERAGYHQRLEKLEQGTGTVRALKQYLWKLAVQYEQTYLLQSYYFL
ncbi:MAG: UV DNA damage repair endonuclease UvsE [Clostridia bacterium]